MIKLTQLFSQQITVQKTVMDSNLKGAEDRTASVSQGLDQATSRSSDTRYFETELQQASSSMQTEQQRYAERESARENSNRTNQQDQLNSSTRSDVQSSQPSEAIKSESITSASPAEQRVSNQPQQTEESAAKSAKKSPSDMKQAAVEIKEAKLEEIQVAIDDVKKSIEGIKREITSLLKELGIEIDPKALSKHQVESLKVALKSLKDIASQDNDIQLNSLVHVLKELGVPVKVDPMNVIVFTSGNKTETSYLGTIEEKGAAQLSALIEKLSTQIKKVDDLFAKKIEIKDADPKKLLQMAMPGDEDKKTGFIEKIKDVFTRSTAPVDSKPVQKRAHSEKEDAVESTLKPASGKETVSNTEPKIKETFLGDNQQSHERKDDTRQGTDRTAFLAQKGAAAAEQLAQGRETKFSESITIQHSVKVEGQKVTIEKVKQTSQGQGAEQTHIVRQVVKQVTFMVDSGKTSMTMQLKPEHLGRVSIDLNMEDSKMRLSMKVENAEAKTVLDAGVVNLKEVLSAQGITIESVDVEVYSESQFAGLKEEQDEQKRSFKGHKRINDVALDVDIEMQGSETGRRLGYNTMEYVG